MRSPARTDHAEAGKAAFFLFWTITHLARRLVTRDGRELSAANVWAVLGAGAVGALAYTYRE